MTLRRWFEQECGNSNERYSWAIERNEESGKPFHVRYLNNGGVRVAHPIPDREAGARKRLDAIMTHRNKRNVLAKDGASDSLSYYIQTDPRGAALYILRPCDVPDGGDPSAYYSRGICVY
jgi:hypothetical protein